MVRAPTYSIRLDKPPTHARAHADSMRRKTSAVRSSADGNKLSGALPAALGALTDLVALCARPPQSRAAGKARRGRAPAESVRSRARVVLRSSLGSNGLTGTIGGWIGSLAKLTRLYARARACTGGTAAAAHAHSRGGYCLGVLEYSAPYTQPVRRSVCACAACVRPQTHALAYIDTYRYSVSTQSFHAEHICRCIHLRMGRQIDVYIYIYITYIYNRACF